MARKRRMAHDPRHGHDQQAAGHAGEGKPGKRRAHAQPPQIGQQEQHHYANAGVRQQGGTRQQPLAVVALVAVEMGGIEKWLVFIHKPLSAKGWLI